MSRSRLCLFLWFSSRVLVVGALAVIICLSLVIPAVFRVLPERSGSPVVLIDAGHGQENDVALPIARLLGEQLQSRGIKVVRTTGGELGKRAGLDQNSLLVGIICETSNKPEKNGPVIYYHSASVLGKELAYCLQRGLQPAFTGNSSPYPCRVPETANFQLLRTSRIPAVLVNAGFLSHNQAEIAVMLASGIQEFLAEKPVLTSRLVTPLACPAIEKSRPASGTATIPVLPDLETTVRQLFSPPRMTATLVPGELQLKSVQTGDGCVTLDFNAALSKFLSDDPAGFRLAMKQLGYTLSRWPVKSFLLLCDGEPLTAADQQQEWDQPVPVAPPPVKLALIIDDLGAGGEGTADLLKLNRPLTLAVMPFMANSTAESETARQLGFEVIVHLSLEANRANPGAYAPKTITTTMEDTAIRTILDEAAESVPAAVGLNNHMGSKATADQRITGLIAEMAQKKHWFIVDSRTTEATQLAKASERLGVPHAERHVFLDHAKSYPAIRNQLLRAAAKARETGSAVAIGHVGEAGGTVTIRVIRELLPQLEDMGISLVPISMVLTYPTGAKG